MWVVFGTSEKTERVAGGAKVARHCDRCGESTTFYEKEIQRTVRLYFIDVFDYERQRVMACGGCGTCYVTDELGGASGKKHEGSGFSALGSEVGRAARSAGQLLERAGDAVGSQLSSLFSDGPGDTPRATRNASERAELTQAADKAEEAEAEAELELDPLEERFRELERKVRVRID